MNIKELGALLIDLVGGKDNIVFVYNCYTRVRINVKDVSKVNQEAIKATETVIGLVIDKLQVQVIVGPGKAVKVAQEMISQLEIAPSNNEHKQEIAKDTKNYLETKSEVRKKTQNIFTSTIRKIGGVFVPIIPMFIACGLLLAIASICNEHITGFDTSTFGRILNVISTSVFTVLNVIVGYNATKEFGGDGIIGAALAGAFSIAGEVGKDLGGIDLGFYTFAYKEVGIFTILLMSVGIAHLEKLLRKFMPDAIDSFVTPLITVIVISAAVLFVLQPIGAGINTGLAYVFGNISKYVPALLGIIPLFYLFLVLTGTHHSLMVVSQALIDKTGVTPIVAVQLMAGAAEVGAAIYILLKSKNRKLKKNIAGSLPIGILGIDEPLIWGMSVPLKRPFIAASIGGFIGGTFIACMRLTTKVPETTGIQAAFLTNKPGMYAIGFVMSIVAGFIVQWLIGFKDPIEVVDETTHEFKEEYIETSVLLKAYQKYREKHPKKTKSIDSK